MEVRLKSYIHGTHESADHVLEHAHDCYELIFYVKGGGKSNINGETYYFKDQSVALVHPGHLHDETYNSPAQVYCCLFSYDGEYPLEEGIYQFENLSELEQMEQLFLQIEEEMRQKQVNYSSFLDYLLGQIVTYLIRLTVEHPATSYSCIQYAKQYIKENSANNLSFQILADQVGYSYDRFRHIFKNVVGVSPAKYLYHVRMERAKKLLAQSDYPVAKVAKMVNMGNPSHFIEVFKKETGLTPRAYRKQEQAEQTAS